MHNDSRYAVDRPTGGGIQKHHAVDGSPWYWGHVRTVNGFATVYSEAAVTTLSFIHAGYEYTRCFTRGFQPRHLVTLANRFAREVTHGLQT
jgi:hypothetical protein